MAKLEETVEERNYFCSILFLTADLFSFDLNTTQKRSNYIQLMTLSSILRAIRNRLWGS